MEHLHCRGFKLSMENLRVVLAHFSYRIYPQVNVLKKLNWTTFRALCPSLVKQSEWQRLNGCEAILFLLAGIGFLTSYWPASVASLILLLCRLLSVCYSLSPNPSFWYYATRSVSANPQVEKIQKARRPARVSLPAISLHPMKMDSPLARKKGAKPSPLASSGGDLSPTIEGNHSQIIYAASIQQWRVESA